MESNQTVNRRRTNNQGFTLVELAAVCVLIALLAGTLGVMGMKRYQARGLEVSARRLYHLARYAKYMAVNRHEPCKLALDDAGKRVCVIVQTTDPLTGRVQDRVVQDRYCKPLELPSAVSFGQIQILSLEQQMMVDQTGETEMESAGGVSWQMIAFQPDGTADGALVTLTNGKKNFTLTIEPGNGRPRIHNGTVEQLESRVIDLDVQDV